jgi:uracil-DNA glycosylase
MDLWSAVPPAWRDPLQAVHRDIARIGEELARECSVIPAQSQIFRALDLAPVQVRVVILGQDPYPNPDHACGLAFSVPPGTRPLPPSLRNILAEVVADVGSSEVTDGDLSPWMSQGVLLLNRTLTTRSGSSNAHVDVGWKHVTECVVDAVVTVNPRVPAVLWGSAAQHLSAKFDENSIVSSAHPSPLSAYRGFFGSKPFSHVNAILQRNQQAPIRW